MFYIRYQGTGHPQKKVPRAKLRFTHETSNNPCPNMSRRQLEAVSYADRRDETIFDTVGPELAVADSDGRTQVC